MSKTGEFVEFPYETYDDFDPWDEPKKREYYENINASIEAGEPVWLRRDFGPDKQLRTLDVFMDKKYGGHIKEQRDSGWLAYKISDGAPELLTATAVNFEEAKRILLQAIQT